MPSRQLRIRRRRPLSRLGAAEPDRGLVLIVRCWAWHPSAVCTIPLPVSPPHSDDSAHVTVRAARSSTVPTMRWRDVHGWTSASSGGS